MGSTERILALLAALIFTLFGYLELEKPVSNVLLVTLSFLVAGVFLYTFFGRKGIVSSSFTEINNESKTLVLGPKDKKVSKSSAFKIAMVTFGTVVVSFGLGFGVGKLFYHLIH